MPGPLFSVAGSRVQSASAATLSPIKPTVFTDGGGRLLAVVTSKNNATHATATAGWTRIGAQINSGASFTASLWEAEQGAASPVFTWTGAAACSAQVVYYVDPNNPIDSIVAGTNNNGTANPHTTASFNSTRANSLAVYVDVAAANTALTNPATWTQDVTGGSGTDVGRTTFGSKVIATSGSASGAISVNGAAAAWVQWQVEVKSSVSPGGAQFSKVEAGVWEEPGAGASFSKVEAGVWEEPGAGFSASKVEASVWLDVASNLFVTKMERGAWLEPPTDKLYVTKLERGAWLDRSLDSDEGYICALW